ncbi:MAG: M48 family metallopeptidase [Phycisphaerales bacterium]|nr:M48 family metallopeptidase [Phycisphaerales bacterium]
MASFFEQQDKAQSRTWILGVFFAMGMVAIFAVAWLATAILLQGRSKAIMDPAVIGGTFLAIGAVTVLPALWKYVTLGGHGSKVAQALGGVRIDPATRDPDERKVMNVVEEMAIASGMPVPPVFLIQDPSINAFAAGTTIRDAALGITTGAIEQLSRDELEGVMAHEFSHVFHGDMRINLRAMAAIFGMMALGYVGYILLRSAPRGGSRKNNGAAGIALFGLALAAIGAIGTFFGRIMQAAISRQREFLADATAVQYTRNPAGIAGALRKIARLHDPTLAIPQASQFNHFFFTEGVRTWMASHPPLNERIRRIETMAGGVLPEAPSRAPRAAAGSGAGAAPAARVPGASVPAGAAAAGLVQALSGVGSVDRVRIDAVHEALERTPNLLRAAAHDPMGARAVVYASLLAGHDESVEARLHAISSSDPAAADECREMIASMRSVPARHRLALVEMACSALVALPLHEYQSFRGIVSGIMRTDSRIDLYEWTVAQILRSRVEDRLRAESARPTADRVTLRSVQGPVVSLLGLVACTTGKDADHAVQAFAAGLASLGLSAGRLPDPAQRSLDALSEALDSLGGLKPSERGRLLSACVTIATHDGNVRDDEVFIVRSIAERLAVPLPPAIAA